jgi:hypothetical protein
MTQSLGDKWEETAQVVDYCTRRFVTVKVINELEQQWGI